MGYNAVPTFADIDGDGDLDVLTGNLGNINFFENIGDATNPSFATAQTNPFGLTNVGSDFTPTLADIDGDGDLDVLTGNLDGNINFFENIGDATNPSFATAQTNPFGLTNVGDNAVPTFADIDGDGDLDAFVGNFDGDTYFFENTSAVANQPPVANDDSLTTDEDTAIGLITVLANDSDADGDPLTVTGFDATGTIGTVIDNGDGTFSYDPNGQFEALNMGDTATDSFTYTITDGTETDTATVTFTINGVTDSIAAVTDYTIFSQQVNSKEFTVGLKDGNPVYQIDHIEIPNQSVNAFLNEAVAELGGQTIKNGTINEGGLEHFGGTQNPSIREKDTVDDVIISGSGVGGRYQADFDNDTAAAEFVEFANDLLGRDPDTPKFFEFKGSTNGGANNIQIFSNDEIIELNPDLSNGFDTPDSLLFRWSGADTPGRPTTNYLDEFIEEMGTLFGGTQLQDDEIENVGLQNPGTLTGANLNQVDLLSGGAPNQEVYEFSNQQEAQNFLNFFNSVVDATVEVNPFGLANVESESAPTVADIDGDEDLDAPQSENLGNINENTDDASDPSFATAQTNPFGLTNVGSNAVLTFADIDGDGDLDAFVGNGAGNLDLWTRTRLYRREGKDRIINHPWVNDYHDPNSELYAALKAQVISQCRQMGTLSRSFVGCRIGK